ncbi:MAG: hypothetical protein WCD37_17640 [Chloroflexia bacterium]
MATKDKPQGEAGMPTTKSAQEETTTQPQQTLGAEDISDSATGAPDETSQEHQKALPPPPAGLPANYPRQGRPTIRKGIYLSALIYVEGDRPPAQNFTREAKNALRKILEEAFANASGDLTMTLKRIRVQNNVEDEEPNNPNANASTQEEKFDF